VNSSAFDAPAVRDWYGFQSGLGAALGDGLFACHRRFQFDGLGAVDPRQLHHLADHRRRDADRLRPAMYYRPPPSRINDTYGPSRKAPPNTANGKNGTNGKNGQDRVRAAWLPLSS